MIDTESGAREVAQRWLDANMREPAGTFCVRGVADVGPIWRVVVGWGAIPSWASALRVDKGTGEVRLDFSPSSRVGASAREGYAAMMRGAVLPELRRLGFVGSGRNFTLPAPDHYATLSFQQSRGNVWTLARFTANLSVISHEEWSEWSEWSAARVGVTEPADRPRPGWSYAVGWSERLGMVSQHDHDYWWSVWAGFPTDDVAADLVAAIRDHAVPAMREMLG